MNRLWRTTGAIDYELLPRNTAMREHEKRILSRKGCGDGVARCCPRICGGGWLEHGERRCGTGGRGAQLPRGCNAPRAIAETDSMVPISPLTLTRDY